MTFLATYDGKLEPGRGRTKVVGRWTYNDWPEPWGFRCDECGREFPYQANAHGREPLVPPTVRAIGPDRHRCAYCEGYVEQIGLGL